MTKTVLSSWHSARYIWLLQKHQQICFHSRTVNIMYIVNERLPAESAKSEDLCTWYRITRTWIFSLYHAAALYILSMKPGAFASVHSFCKSAVAQPFRGHWLQCQVQQLPPWSAEPLPSQPGPTLNLTTHTFSFGPVLQIGSGNQFVIKITLLGLRAQSGTRGYVKHAESNGQPYHNHSWGIWLTCQASHWMTGALVSSVGQQSIPSMPWWLLLLLQSLFLCWPLPSMSHDARGRE